MNIWTWIPKLCVWIYWFYVYIKSSLDARQCFDWLPLVSNEETYLMFSLCLGENMHQENSWQYHSFWRTEVSCSYICLSNVIIFSNCYMNTQTILFHNIFLISLALTGTGPPICKHQIRTWSTRFRVKIQGYMEEKGRVGALLKCFSFI